jgi:glycosyltransferase involved in cell wall biosynthesis
MKCADDKEISVVLIAQEAWAPQHAGFTHGLGPDPMEIYRVMKTHGINVKLTDPNDGVWKWFGGMHRIFRSLDPLRALRILALERKCDLVISVFESSSIPLFMLRRLFFFRAPIAIWDVSLTETWRLGRRIHDYVLPRADHFFLLSSYQQFYIETHWPARAKFFIVGQDIDTDFYKSSGMKFEKGPVLSVGDDAGRDYATYMQAIAGLPADFVIRSRKSIDVPGTMQSRVRIIPERLSFLDLRKLYDSSRFVVVPLHKSLNVSGIGTVLEAMAMGKAFIVSDSPTIRDYLVPDQTCLVVEPGNARQLRNAIIHLLDNPDIAARLGAEGRKFAERKFSLQVFGARMGEAIRAAVVSARVHTPKQLL